MSILVLGLGNVLMNDDAVGIRAVEELQKRYIFPDSVRLLDGGTLGLDLLPRLEGVEKLLIIDALQMGAAPGEVFRLEDEEVPRAFANKLSVHQMGLQDLLAVAELQGHLPPQLVVCGVQSESIEMSLQMSEPVTRAMEKLLAAVVAVLNEWKVALQQAA
jgi:hydrogenase maturation protease